MVQKGKGFIDINTQVLDVTFRQDGGIHDSEWWMGREAGIFILAGGRQAVE
jgi:hypothetical protein